MTTTPTALDVVVEPKRKTRRGIVAFGVAALVVGFAAHSAANSSNSSTTADAPSSEALFKAELMGHTDLIASAAAHMTTAGDAASSMDIDVAVDDSSAAARDFRELHRMAASAPGADTPLGVLVLDTYETCAEANEAGASAMAALDVDAIEAATTMLGDCNDLLGDATAAIS